MDKRGPPGTWYEVEGVRGEKIRLRVPWPKGRVSTESKRDQKDREAKAVRVLDWWAPRGVRHP